MNIKKIHLKGYKSAADILLEDVSPFAVFAGANGAGKSNLADGLAFLGQIVKSGVKQAVSKAGGFKQIHCYKLSPKARTSASLELDVVLKGQTYHYSMLLKGMDGLTPILTETLSVDGEQVLERKGGKLRVKMMVETDSQDLQPQSEQRQEFPQYPPDVSALMMKSDLPLYQFLTNIRVFRFDAAVARRSDVCSVNTAELESNGRNLATVLSSLQADEDLREEITEWIDLLIPGTEWVTTETQTLDGRTELKFKEQGLPEPLFASQVSDGALYGLCNMVTILSRTRNTGLTFIESPERNLHPYAASELVAFFRQETAEDHPVFITTHSASVIRATKELELWQVNKADGMSTVQREPLPKSRMASTGKFYDEPLRSVLTP